MGVIENRIDITELERSGGGGGGGTAASVSYDNTSSHMTATDVQAALDELNLNVVEGLALVDTSVASTRDMIAPSEGETASAAYEIGDQIIYNNLLYKVTATIAIGDTITPGTNVTLADSVSVQLQNAKLKKAPNTASSITAYNDVVVNNCWLNNMGAASIIGLVFTTPADGLPANSNILSGIPEIRANNSPVIGGNQTNVYNFAVGQLSDHTGSILKNIDALPGSASIRLNIMYINS